MKKVTLIMAAVLVIFSLVPAIYAADKASKDECMAKVNEAVKLAQDKGMQAALDAVAKKDGPFVWKDTYVFAIDVEKQANVAHPIKPSLVGKNLMGIKDAGGKMFFAEFIITAKEKGEGWVDYMWPKPGEKKPSPKTSFVKIVPGTTVVFIAGIYPE